MRTKSKNYNIILIFLLISGIFYGEAFSQEGGFTQKNAKHSEKNREHPTNPVLYPLQFFRKYISRADGNRCSMYPSCSEYSIRAFNTHGFFMGWIMTCDRLLRCGKDELNLSAPIWVDGKKRCYDPLNNNDFWWKKDSRSSDSSD